MATSKRLKVTIVADGQKQVFSGSGEPAALVCAFRAWLELGARFEMAEGADDLDRAAVALSLERDAAAVRVKFADREVVYGSAAEAREHLERLRSQAARADLVVEADEAMGVPSVASDVVLDQVAAAGVGPMEVPAGAAARSVHEGMSRREVREAAFAAIEEVKLDSQARAEVGMATVLTELHREVFFVGNADWYAIDRIASVVNAPVEMIRRALSHMVKVGQLRARPRDGRTEWCRA